MTNSGNEGPQSNPVELARTLTMIADKSQRLMNGFIRHQVSSGALDLAEMTRVSQTFMTMLQQLLANPGQLALAQMELWQRYAELWQRHTASWLGQPTAPMIDAGSGDIRFRHEAWQNNLVFDFIKQSYLLTARWLHCTIGRLEGLDDNTRGKLDFYTRQFIDALAPTNFPLTNPEVLRATLDSGGQNLLSGLANLLSDLEHGWNRLNVYKQLRELCEPGRDVATTPGEVVYQNELMQLIQYAPTTATVYRRPLLIVPPWFNKYYLFDLQEQNSLVRWWVAQGFTVFMISWVDPDAGLAQRGFDDYLRDGPLAALDAIEQATGEHEVTAIGYDLGGTLLACLLAYLSARGEQRVTSAALLTAMLDFERPGELEVFIDEEQLRLLEPRDTPTALEPSVTTFNLLRANDLMWSFFVSSYLLGRERFPFELLCWNADTTRMPVHMHGFYLRHLYLDDLLKEPGGVTLLGTPIDLGRVTIPIYLVATVDDHLVPWRSVYAGSHLLGGPTHFVLGGSGHVTGVAGPPTAVEYGYWTCPGKPAAADDWFNQADLQAGSWWNDWYRWVATQATEQVAARIPGSGALEALEPAPGSYVKSRAGR